MRLSIALASFNGAKYIIDQLESFVRQSRLPDELVVCDDCSQDGTAEIVQEFAKTAPFVVKLVRNDRRIGVAKNFEKSISLCTGNIILISDQDDVWLTYKLQIVEDIFKNQLEVLVTLNDQELVDENLAKTGITTYGNCKGLGINILYSFGCCTAFRSNFRDIILPFPENVTAYDGWVHRLADGLNSRLVINDVLQFYRRHTSNQSDSMVSRLRKTNFLTPLMDFGLGDPTIGWVSEINVSTLILQRLNERRGLLSEIGLDKTATVFVEKEAARLRAYQQRLRLLNSHGIDRFREVIRFSQAGGYSHFAGWKSVIKDLIR